MRLKATWGFHKVKMLSKLCFDKLPLTHIFWSRWFFVAANLVCARTGWYPEILSDASQQRDAFLESRKVEGLRTSNQHEYSLKTKSPIFTNIFGWGYKSIGSKKWISNFGRSTIFTIPYHGALTKSGAAPSCWRRTCGTLQSLVRVGSWVCRIFADQSHKMI